MQASSSSLMTIDVSGSQILASGVDSVIRVWKFDPHNEPNNQYQPVQSFAGHNDHILTGILDQKNSIAVTGGLDRDIKVWNSRDGTLLRTIQRHTSHVRCLAMHPTRPLLFSAGEDRVIGVWDIDDWLADKPHGTDAQFGGQNDELYIQNRNEISVWDTKLQKPIFRISDHPSRISAMAVNSHFVASGYFDGHCRIWDAASGKLIAEAGNPEHKAIYSMAWAGDKICLAHHRRIVEVIDAQDPDSAVEIETEGQPYRIAFVRACNAIGGRDAKGIH